MRPPGEPPITWDDVKLGPLIRSERATWRRVGEDAVVVDIQTGGVYELGGPAVRIWELLEESPTLDELMATLEIEYSGDRGTLRADTERTIAELIDAGLLRG